MPTLKSTRDNFVAHAERTGECPSCFVEGKVIRLQEGRCRCGFRIGLQQSGMQETTVVKAVHKVLFTSENTFLISVILAVILSAVAFRLSLRYIPSLPPTPPVVKHAYCIEDYRISHPLQPTSDIDYGVQPFIWTLSGELLLPVRDWRLPIREYCDPEIVDVLIHELILGQ